MTNCLITVWTSVAFLVTVISNWWIFTNSTFWASFTPCFNITIITRRSSFTGNPFILSLLFTIIASRWFFDLHWYIGLTTVFTFWTVFSARTIIFMIVGVFNTCITIGIGFTSRLLTFFISFFITIITVRIIANFTFTVITIYCFTVFMFWACFIIRNITIRNYIILFRITCKLKKKKNALLYNILYYNFFFFCNLY